KQYYVFTKRQAEARKALNTHRLNHDLLHLSRIQVRASGRWRAVEILGGLIVIALAIFALADPQFTIQTLVIVIAAGLILGGLFRITVGAFATVLRSPLRSRNIVPAYTGPPPLTTPIGHALTDVRSENTRTSSYNNVPLPRHHSRVNVLVVPPLYVNVTISTDKRDSSRFAAAVTPV